MSQNHNDPPPISPKLDALLAIGSEDDTEESERARSAGVYHSSPGPAVVAGQAANQGLTAESWVYSGDAGVSEGSSLTPAAPKSPGPASPDSSDGVGQKQPDDELTKLAIDLITPNPYQPRREFDPTSLTRLAESIEALGILQPIVVRRLGDGRFELIAGERRWRAARLAGLEVVPCVVRVASDQRSLEEAIVENLHRSDLNVFEEAAAYQRLMDDFGLTQEEVGQRVGKSRSAVANIMRLMQLSSEVQELVISGQLGTGHARALLSLPTHAERRRYAAYCIKNRLTARQMEDLVKRGLDPSSSGSKSPGNGERQSKSAAALEIERGLSDRLSTRVEVREGTGNGQIVVEFADLDDLGRIYELLSEARTDQVE